ncbi:unnamed protein product [Dibothriocephalus latus]|uniref:Uncharacterized protein n=1 Tax=Dibothriocephalus latus TaxID=60516 RepID=A0A3P7LRH8_DIBLA|nr:unnamed protein product [Dibothriocephalus latus]
MEDGGLGIEGIPCGKARVRNGIVRPVAEYDERSRRMNESSVSGISTSSGLDRTIAALPNQRTTVEMVLFTRICSRVRQSVLGKYDSTFIVDPRAVPLLEERSFYRLSTQLLLLPPSLPSSIPCSLILLPLILLASSPSAVHALYLPLL